MPRLPSPAVQRDASLYVTDPMQIPLPPPLSPDDGEATPQNPEPVSSPIQDGEEVAQEEKPVARTPIENMEAAILIAERLAREYERLATPSPVPSQQQQQQQLAYSAPKVGFGLCRHFGRARCLSPSPMGCLVKKSVVEDYQK